MARKKARDRKRQTKINFLPTSEQSQATISAAAASTADLPTRPPRKQQNSTESMSSRKRKGKRQDSTSEDELAIETRRGIFDGPAKDASDSDSTIEEKEQAKKHSRSSRKRQREEPSGESDGEEPTITVIPRKRQRRSVKVEESSSEENKKKDKKEKKQSKRHKVKENTPDDDEDELCRPTQSPEREDVKILSPSAEEQELKEELAFLQSSPVADRGRLRSTHEKPKSKRQEALEALKRRRAGTTGPPATGPPATPGRRRRVVADTDSESELEVKEEPDSEANALDMFQEDQDDEQFIDDDPENVIGEPSANADLDEMREAFSISRAKTKDLFDYAVEWMVMKKIHPGFEATKYTYTATFRKLDDEVKGLAGSKYTSSAWTADFTRAVRARPNLIINDLSAAERAVISPHCEACNRTNHTASSELLLQGQPYDPETLEPVASDSDSNSDSDSSGFSSDSEAMLNYNHRKERILPESHCFPVGSTCKANTQVAHTLYHWRYHLYQWVKDYLKAEGHLTPEKLVKRDSWSNRKRDKAARKILKAMKEKGQIRELYHSYKNQVTAAMEADNDYKNGWGRR